MYSTCCMCMVSKGQFEVVIASDLALRSTILMFKFIKDEFYNVYCKYMDGLMIYVPTLFFFICLCIWSRYYLLVFELFQRLRFNKILVDYMSLVKYKNPRKAK